MKTFSTDDTAVILIDHQVGTNTWASTTPLPLLQRNVIKNWATPAGAVAFPLLTA